MNLVIETTGQITMSFHFLALCEKTKKEGQPVTFNILQYKIQPKEIPFYLSLGSVVPSISRTCKYDFGFDKIPKIT